MGNLPKKYQSGQTLLLVLLSMAVVLTIVLSILARSVTDVSLSTKEEESLRAFSAAEAGVEKALIAGSSVFSAEGGTNESYNAQVTGFAKGERDFAYPLTISSGDSAVIWFVGHDDSEKLVCSAEFPCFTGKTVKVCWGNPGTVSDGDTTPAIELSVIYASAPNDYSTLKVARETLDPNEARRATNKFTVADTGGCTAGGESYQFSKVIDLGVLGILSPSYSVANGLQYARIKMIYNSDVSQPLGVDVNYEGNSLLPAQGLEINSSGSYGDSNRKVSVFQGYPETPSIFEGSIFSQNSITQGGVEQ